MRAAAIESNWNGAVGLEVEVEGDRLVNGFSREG
jgi:hypothetical protein